MKKPKKITTKPIAKRVPKGQSRQAVAKKTTPKRPAKGPARPINYGLARML